MTDTLKIIMLICFFHCLAFSNEAISQENGKAKYAIAIHGGAGTSPEVFSDEAVASRRASMKKALEIGSKILKEGGTSLDAVEKVVRFLEDDPQFNAGVGAVFNAAGGHELDASIMDGRDLSCGAVAGVSTVKNPISLARMVMEKTRHVLFAGNGAEKFAKQMGVELVEPSHFDTDGTKERFNKRRARSKAQSSWQKDSSKGQRDVDAGSYHGTVGCVALDNHGNLAAATSTGGLSNKEFGRVGDSPIVGAGTYADNKTCAISCTGKGEEYIRRAIAYDISAQIRYKNVTLDDAVKEVLTNQLKKGDGGVIGVDKNGKVSMRFNTGGMARAAADSDGRFDVFWDKDLKQSKEAVDGKSKEAAGAK